MFKLLSSKLDKTIKSHIVMCIRIFNKFPNHITGILVLG